MTTYLFILSISAAAVSGAASGDLPVVNVFKPGDANISCYRIPAVVQTANGSLLAFAEARHGSCSDAATHEIATSRSVDGGKTWSAVQFASGGPDNRAGNPYPVSLASGKTVLIYRRYMIDGSLSNGIVESSDDGLTWSAERDIGAGFGVAKGAMPGPGAGIELDNGRIVVISHAGACK